MESLVLHRDFLLLELSPFYFSVCNIFSEKEFENSTDEWLDEEQLCKESKWEVVTHQF